MHEPLSPDSPIPDSSMPLIDYISACRLRILSYLPAVVLDSGQYVRREERSRVGSQAMFHLLGAVTPFLWVPCYRPLAHYIRWYLRRADGQAHIDVTVGDVLSATPFESVPYSKGQLIKIDGSWTGDWLMDLWNNQQSCMKLLRLMVQAGEFQPKEEYALAT